MLDPDAGVAYWSLELGGVPYNAPGSRYGSGSGPGPGTGPGSGSGSTLPVAMTMIQEFPPPPRLGKINILPKPYSTLQSPRSVSPPSASRMGFSNDPVCVIVNKVIAIHPSIYPASQVQYSLV